MEQISIKYKNNISKSGWGQLNNVSPNLTGWQLKTLLAEQDDSGGGGGAPSIHPAEMKLLHKGKFLKDEVSIGEQGVNSKSSILIQQGPPVEKSKEIKEKLEKQENTERIIKAAETVASRTKDNNDDEKNYRFEIENQDGTKVKIDPEDNKNLVLAMSLHEKGKKMLEKNDHSTGLKFFIEADSAFLRLKDESFLERIDNYARLNLDIMWSILKSKDLTLLAENSWRLGKAHEILKKAYGENNERLIELRGGCCPDLIIYVRLFLLQGIIYYHAGDLRKAKSSLLLCEHKLNQMTIAEDDMLELLQMGFSVRESRVGLRACNRNSHEAIQWLLLRREKEEEKKVKEAIEKAERKKQKSYGKTCNNHFVSMKLLKVLVSMGFKEELVVEALKQSDNDEENAKILLLESPHLLEVAVMNSKPSFLEEKKEQIDALIGMGFTLPQAYGTLKAVDGIFEAALEKLLSGEGVEEIPPPMPVPAEVPGPGPAPAPAPAPGPAPAPAPDPTPAPDDSPSPVNPAPMDEQAEKEKQLLTEAENDLLDDIETDELKDYDVELTEESDYLNQYRVLLDSNLS